MAIAFQSWRNQNRYRNYPFRDDSSLVPNEDSGLELPYDFIVDFAITVPVNETYGVVPSSSAEVRLSAMMYAEPSITLFFSLSDGTNLASTAIPDLSTHLPGNTYPVNGVSAYDDVRGFVVLGDLERLRSSFPPGSYKFSNAFFEMSTVRPVLRGVRSIRAGTGTIDTIPLYGAVKLIEGANVKLSVIPEENAIRIDAIRGEGLETDDCGCDEARRLSTVKTVNGISVSDLKIIGGQCVEVVEAGNTIKISDKCSKPCCGCQELDWITDKLAYLETAVSHVESVADTMKSVVPQSVMAVSAAAKTGGYIETTEIKT